MAVETIYATIEKITLTKEGSLSVYTRTRIPENHSMDGCRSTKTQVNPSSALKTTKHHQSNPSNVPGILVF